MDRKHTTRLTSSGVRELLFCSSGLSFLNTFNQIAMKVKRFLKTGIELIDAERQKQIDKHGFTGAHHVDHPERYDNFQLQYAATTLLMHEFEEVVDTKDHLPDGWDQEWFDKLNAKTRKERLIIAGALIAAELDRLETGLLLTK